MSRPYRAFAFHGLSRLQDYRRRLDAAAACGDSYRPRRTGKGTNNKHGLAVKQMALICLEWLQRQLIAFAAAWAPNPKKPPFYFDTPTVNGVQQSEVVAALSANAGITMLHQYVRSLESLNAIGMEIEVKDNLFSSNE